LPIQYALTWPHRVEGSSESIDWQTFNTLEFQQIDYSTFPAISLAYGIMKEGGTSGAILNAANEIVVTAFLEQGLPFGSMITIVSETLDKIEIVQDAVIGAVIEADEEARSLATQLVAKVTVHT